MKSTFVMILAATCLLLHGILRGQDIPKNVKPFVRLVTEALYVVEYQDGKMLRSYVTREANVCGSGTVISKDGLILTNYHVARPRGVHTTEEGVTIAYATATNSMKVYELSDNDPLRKPRLRYIANYLGGDKGQDMAILKIVADANTGETIKNPNFDYVSFGGFV